MTSNRNTWVGLILATCTTTCGGTELEPAQSATEAENLRDTIRARERGVEVLARAGDWPGEAEISSEVTPLKVLIINRSQHPPRIGYEDFKLTVEGGDNYHVIPPLQVSGWVDGEPEHIEPDFFHEEFYVERNGHNSSAPVRSELSRRARLAPWASAIATPHSQ